MCVTVALFMGMLIGAFIIPIIAGANIWFVVPVAAFLIALFTDVSVMNAVENLRAD